MYIKFGMALLGTCYVAGTAAFIYTLSECTYVALTCACCMLPCCMFAAQCPKDDKLVHQTNGSCYPERSPGCHWIPNMV